MKESASKEIIVSPHFEFLAESGQNLATSMNMNCAHVFDAIGR